MSGQRARILAAVLVAGVAIPTLAVAPGAAPAKIGVACHIWENRSCLETVDVFSDGQVVMFRAKLAIDADGAPRAYHPGDTASYDDLIDIEPDSLYGIQGLDAVGPAPGFYVSATSLFDRRYPENDTRHWVDASSVPYFVAIPHLPTPDGRRLKLGSLGVVVDLKTGVWSGALYADEGYAVGEGSIALAQALGLNPIQRRHPPKLTGFDGKRFLYIVFPDAERPPPPWTQADVQAGASTLFATWGGEARLRTLYPSLPPLRRLGA